MLTELTAQQIVTVVIAMIVPIVVGLVTKASTSAGLKATILAGVTVLVGVGQGFVNTPAGETWAWKVAVFNAVIAWVVAVATYFGYYKPAGVAGWAQSKLNKDA